MEFLKEFISEELYSQLEQELKGKEVKLANLTTGKYVSKGKYDALETEKTNIESQLSEATTKIESFSSMDIEAVKKESQEWQKKLEELKEDSAKKIKDMKIKHETDKEIIKAKAKDSKIIMPLLEFEKIKLENDKIDGIAEQIEAIKKSHPYLFDQEEIKQEVQESLDDIDSKKTEKKDINENSDILSVKKIPRSTILVNSNVPNDKTYDPFLEGFGIEN